MNTTDFNKIDAIAEARGVIDKEIDALVKVRDAMGAEFEKCLELILNCKGKVILTGMGKSGHIGTKIAATFASLGTPAFFMHPGEAMHGDLGMVEKKDVVFLMSHSGESTEVTSLIPVLNEIGCITVAVTGREKSTLARECNYRYTFPEMEEACSLKLAPTSSTTTLLAWGDALAVVSSRARNYTKEDFGLHHPAGALGKRLLLKVKDIMHSGDGDASVPLGSSLQSAIVEMSGKGLSMVTIIDNEGKLRGIITDGDLRRMLEKSVDVYNVTVDEVMTANPKSTTTLTMAAEALQRMSDLHITCMPVVDENGLVAGTVLMQDIIKAGVV